MNRADLIDELRTNVLRDTTTAVGGSGLGVQWSDAALLRHLDNAYLQFAADTRCLRDATTAEVCNITLAEGQTDYQLHASILHVLRVKTPTRHLAVMHSPGDAGAPICAHTGAPYRYSVDSATRTLSVWPTPDQASDGMALTLLVARRPLALISAMEATDEPEMPPEYHMALVSYAAYHLLRDHDAALAGDANNMSIVQAFASSHKKAYTEAVTRCLQTLRRQASPPIQFAGVPAWS